SVRYLVREREREMKMAVRCAEHKLACAIWEDWVS
mgnify:CR=1